MTAMIDRFLDDAGRANLIDAMMVQAMIANNSDLATEMADRLELLSLNEGDTIIAQGAEDDHLYLIITGSLRIEVNGRQIAVRGQGSHVGEMAAIEPTQRRSASVIAVEPSIVGKLTNANLTDLGRRYPEIYRAFARTLARRLLERNKLVGNHREEIKVFIISSAETLPVAQIIQSALAHDALVTLWTDGVFRATSYAIEALENAVDDADFAIAVAHSDDLTLFRGSEWPTPRDNVVFELGLFMGRLGRKRAILMEPREDKLKLPSDLSGITTIPYSYEAGKDAKARMAPACNDLRDHIKEWGAFNG
ncbi:TIR domain-containing protein [Sphingomonas pruni]|uniref:TIR domain-containing protein n=1 Tax=Sphingomonas pruni TaxID=40683 RepID=UPI000A001CDA|nr:TIR domain-containing protein [Sphingomonas pruni]